MNSKIVILSFLFLCVSCADVVLFSCTTLNTTLMVPGGKIYLPDSTTDSNNLGKIPANFNCTYSLTVPQNTYVKISISYSLYENDQIRVVDNSNYNITLTSGIAGVHYTEFYALNGQALLSITTGSLNVSEASIIFEWVTMQTIRSQINVNAYGNGAYVNANNLRQAPTVFKTTNPSGQVSLNIARAGSSVESFENFFVFDGPNTTSTSLGRLSEFITTPVVSSTQSITVLGLADDVMMSSLIFANDYSNIKEFDKYAAVSLAQQYLNITLHSANLTTAITILSVETSQIYFRTFNYVTIDEPCIVTTKTGSPSNSSKGLIDYLPEYTSDNNFPQQFPASMITMYVKGCDINVLLSKDAPNDYNIVQAGKSGYIFTPSYLDDSTNSTLNVTLSSNDTVSFAIELLDIIVLNKDQLSINIYDRNDRSTFSTVLTANQTSEKTESSGTSLNVAFTSQDNTGYFRMAYSVTSSSSDHLILVTLAAVFLRALTFS